TAPLSAATGTTTTTAASSAVTGTDQASGALCRPPEDGEGRCSLVGVTGAAGIPPMLGGTSSRQTQDREATWRIAVRRRRRCGVATRTNRFLHRARRPPTA